MGNAPDARLRGLETHSERQCAACNAGTGKTELAKEFPNLVVVWTDLPQRWWPQFCENDVVLEARVSKSLSNVAARPQHHIAVIEHGGVFSRIIGYHLRNYTRQKIRVLDNGAVEIQAPI